MKQICRGPPVCAAAGNAAAAITAPAAATNARRDSDGPPIVVIFVLASLSSTRRHPAARVVLYLIAAFWQAPHGSRRDVLTFAAASRVCSAAHVLRSTYVPQTINLLSREIVMADNTVRGR